PQVSRQYLSAIFGNSSSDLCASVISQNNSTCSIILNFLNVQMPPRREPDHPAHTQATVVAQFRDYHAEKFSGQGDPRIVDEWIQGLEFIFEVMECPKRYRVVCAHLQLTGDARLWWNAYWSMRPGEKAGLDQGLEMIFEVRGCSERHRILCAQFQMTGDARLWWNAYWGMRPRENENLTWAQFKNLLREKYYRTYYRTEIERQFLVLEQGNSTVDEYEREFTRLGFFVTYMVDTEEKRSNRFREGLLPKIHHNLAGHVSLSYADTVTRAQKIDVSFQREAARVQSQPIILPVVQPAIQPLAQPVPNQHAKNKNKRKVRGQQDDCRNMQRRAGPATQQRQIL
ncbi:Unknown protein, partial [Striga hermonthica]